MDDESPHLLDEHTFEEPKVLYRNEKVAGAISLLFLCSITVSACYHGIHFNLWSLFLISLFLASVFVLCILIGRILVRIQEHRVLSGQPEQFNEYVERLNNPVTHEKFAPNPQTRFLGIKLPPSIFGGSRPTYV